MAEKLSEEISNKKKLPPPLNLEPVKLQRSKSFDNVDGFEKLLKSHRETYEDIEDIKKKLSIIQSSVKYDDADIRKELKEILEHVNSLVSESDRAPRVLSRCDAIVGNTQGILTKLQDLNDGFKILKKDSNIRHSVMVSMLSELTRDVSLMKRIFRELIYHISISKNLEINDKIKPEDLFEDETEDVEDDTLKNPEDFKPVVVINKLYNTNIK